MQYTPNGFLQRSDLNCTTLHYIRGVKGDQVVFGPEFIYLLDARLPAIAGVTVHFDIRGRADPGFPDFSKHGLFSVSSLQSREIIFPAWAGRLLVGVDKDIEERKVLEDLGKFGDNPRQLLESLYALEVVPFYETDVIEALRADLPYFRYAERDGVMRIVDFSPGWYEDRVM